MSTARVHPLSIPATTTAPVLSRELLLWAAAAVWCLWPSRFTEWWPLGGVPISNVNWTVVALAFCYALARIVDTEKRPGTLNRPGLRLVQAVLVTFAYAALSSMWSGRGWEDSLVMGGTVFTAACSACVGYWAVAGNSPDQVRGLLWRATVCLSVVAAIYSAESLFSLGFRGASVSSSDFGIERVRGPLFESSTGHIILLPALAFAIQHTLDRRVSRSVGLAVIFALAVSILGLGSRAALLVLGIFLGLAFLVIRDRRLRATLTAGLIIAGGIAGYMVFSRANTERLQTVTATDGRAETHLTALRILRERPIAESIFGSGYGSLWPWQVTELAIEGQDAYSTGRFLQITPSGPMLYHPHSTFLLLVMECGILGLFLFGKIGLTVSGAAWRCYLRQSGAVFAAGVAASLPALFFDLFLVRRPTREAFWWIFVFGLLALVPRSAPRTSHSMETL